ncbi:Ribonuclease 3 [bioreactor metagenome]|uniref:Ribonuclease 3 n=1 Tax=bioreactor metagenome TaxID=1076179 RepID=A0A645GVK9_9ZZZZ
MLQEYSQARWGQQPVYTVLRTTGPEHQPIYEVEATLHGYVASGRAASRKQAESAAAHVLYLYLTEHEVKE